MSGSSSYHDAGEALPAQTGDPPAPRVRPTRSSGHLVPVSTGATLTGLPLDLSILDSLPFSALVVDGDHHILFANSAAAASAQRTPEALIGTYCPSSIHGLTGPHDSCPLPTAVRLGREATTVVHDEDTGVWMSLSVYPTPYRTADGTPVFLHTARDVSAQHEARAALAASEARYRSLVEHSPDGVFVTDEQNRIVFANRSGAALLSADSPADLEGVDALQFIQPVDRDRALQLIGQALDGQSSTQAGEYRITRADGTETIVEVRSASYLAEGRDLTQTVVRDVGERYRAEEALREKEAQLQRSQKLEAVGQLAGGVAHDFNNLLTAIGGYADLVLSHSETPAAVHADLAEIVAAAGRASSLTRQLLAFSRRQPMHPRLLDLNEVVESTSRILSRLIGAAVTVRFDRAERLWPVEADPNQLEQVLLNLALNARDAMPRGGLLTITTANILLDPSTDLALESAVPAGASSITPHGGEAEPYVSLVVADTGHGMDQATLSRVFEPFFSTKDPSKGSGLGLSTAYGIVSQSGGSLRLYSEPGWGTTAHVYLPAVRAEVDWHPPDPHTVSPRPGGVETILIVEDEASVQRLVSTTLGTHGYAVRAATTPAEALDLTRDTSLGIDLLLTDVVLPGMDGGELAAAMKQSRPGLRVLFMSGYPRSIVMQHGRVDPALRLLEKPFSTADLLVQVRAALDDAGPPSGPR